jgi:hypothetical protein
MMIQFNALEREASEWEKLIQAADSRLQIQSVHKPTRSANSIIEVALEMQTSE